MRSHRSWYHSKISDFVSADSNFVVGTLTAHSDYAILPTQANAWREQIQILQSELDSLDGYLLLEFNIPRMGRRVDTVLLIGSLIFVIEFKIGYERFDRASIDQVWDYAIDLKNFHAASHKPNIIPVLVVTGAEPLETTFVFDKDHVCRPIAISGNKLATTIKKAQENAHGSPIDVEVWLNSHYKPSPTIVEAARSLYSQHSVEAIHTFDAGARNLAKTSEYIRNLATQSRTHHRKVICFVTGVPGSGKTLVGLNLATQRDEDEQALAVFLSGNGPLVSVLREALTRDEFERKKQSGQRVRKKEIAESVKAFIQNVHHFRDDALDHDEPPAEHVVVFDEAQRAWTLRQTAKFMKQKRNHDNFQQSEPEFLISYMDRHPDWALIVCLVGGGQEINTGEAGINAWLEAVHSRFPNWHIHISSRLSDSEYRSSDILPTLAKKQQTHFEDDLHLSTSMRSFRAENVSDFVKALLDCEVEKARLYLSELSSRYPIFLSRDLNAAKQWVIDSARGNERFGLIASSKAMRLKPHAIDIRVSIDPVKWFLNDKSDTRSSYYLEDAATEFMVQGLELDWACVTWDGDFRFTKSGWSFHDFRGSKWTNIKSDENRKYLQNAYRVLLTRARQGMVIFVPHGNLSDPTRNATFYDSTFKYLKDIGVPVIEQG